MAIKIRNERKSRRKADSQQVVFPGAGTSVFGGPTGLTPAEERAAIDVLLGRARRQTVKP